jgi:DNA invertase Pin-like site-specific DNA recombinase
MDEWWKSGVSGAPGAAPGPRAVAYYRHSAQEKQENSIPLQRDQVRAWAAAHGIEVFKEFADHGVSGLSTERRDAFNDMMENWVKKRRDFQYVLVLDVSRWGRFQDIDLSAAYASDCTRQGKQVVYITLGLPKKDDPVHAIVVSLERYRAAQYSRELSEKTFKGAVRVAEEGFLAGGCAPYGLSRMLLDEARHPVQVLKRGERKSIHNQRVTLAPGDPKEVAVVLRIFEEFVQGGQDRCRIVQGLNQDRIPSPSGVLWNVTRVLEILKEELYIGTMVYNRSTQRLLAPLRNNPREKWIRTPSAFPGIVPKDLFDQAQAILEERRRRRTPEYLLERLGEIHRQNGFFTGPSIRLAPENPPVSLYQKNFRGVGRAFQEMFSEILKDVARTVRKKLEAVAGQVEDHSDFIVLDRCLTVLVEPSVPIPCGYTSYWTFRIDPRPVVDITLGVPLSGPPEYAILGYLAFPRLLVRESSICLFSTLDARIEVFGHDRLDFLKDLLQ